MFVRRKAIALATAALLGTFGNGCALNSSRTAPVPPASDLSTAPTKSANNASLPQATVMPVSHLEPSLPAETAPMPSLDPSDTRSDSRAITLVAVLEAVDSNNPTVGVARARVFEAYAQLDRAEALWLPSLRAGVNFNKHEGRIQDVQGNNLEISRGAFYSGLGANALGAGSPAIPGIYANFHLADAIFQPRIFNHTAAAREANAEATTNDYVLFAATAYLELLRATQDRVIAREVHEHAQKLANLTEAYAKSGVGLASDFDRARTELAIRANELLRSDEAVLTASARLAQILSLDPEVLLEPQEPTATPIELVDTQESLAEYVVRGLGSRPEVQESQALVCEAVRRLEREQYAPLVPSVLLGISYGGFSAGQGGDIDNFGDRFDADAVAWWEIRNLGRGESAARREMESRLDQAELRQVAVLDQIAREVVESHNQVQLRRKQIETARDAVKIARDSYTKNLDRIQNGQGLPLEVLQSVQALAQVQRDYLRAITDYNLAQFSFSRALGGTDPSVLRADAAPKTAP